MSDAGGRPPSEGWYAIGGNPNDLAYFNGQLWTWRGGRDAEGIWHQQPIVPPTPIAPPPAAAYGAPPPAGPPPRVPPVTPPGPYSGLPGYPGGQPHGTFGTGAWASSTPPLRPPGQVELRLSEPEPQARWKTLIRGLLVLPNSIVLILLVVAVFFLTVAMWFVALFTARVPDAWWRFSVGVLKWQARTYAYTFFLTDRYPPFHSGDVAYPVWMTLDAPPDRFNRWSVFFRVILIVPAAIVSGVFTYGVEIFSVVTWIVTLVRGRCPRSLHLVNAAWLRYSLRVGAFQLLLTTEYPHRPLGDPTPAYGASSLRNGDIVVTGSTRGLAIVVLVVGALAYLGSSIAQAALTATRVKAQRAISQLNALESSSISAATSYRNRATSCSTWKCLRAATPILLQSLDTQISSIEVITFPTSTTRDDAAVLVAALRGERAVVTRMDHAASRSALEADVRRLTAVTHGLRPLAQKLVHDLNAIG